MDGATFHLLVHGQLSMGIPHGYLIARLDQLQLFQIHKTYEPELYDQDQLEYALLIFGIEEINLWLRRLHEVDLRRKRGERVPNPAPAYDLCVDTTHPELIYRMTNVDTTELARLPQTVWPLHVYALTMARTFHTFEVAHIDRHQVNDLIKPIKGR